MKVKFLFAAMALPLAFAACSQDEFENGQAIENIPSNAIQGLTLNVQKNGLAEEAMTKGTWVDGSNKITFDANDKVSMYWLGGTEEYNTATQRTELAGKFNSIFRTTDGAMFTSESLVFEGGNVAVYPADLAFVNEGTVVLKVPAIQDATVLNNVPYVSNQLYIKKQGNDQATQLPGYYGDKELDCPVKLAANVVNLKLDLSNIPAGYNFEVQSVELQTASDNKAFATESKVTTSSKVANYQGEVVTDKTNNTKKETIISQVWSAEDTDKTVSSLTTKNITKVSENVAIAHFVVLPTDETVTDGSDVKVIVRTNCGTITMASNVTVENKPTEVKYPILNKQGEKTSIATAFASFVQTQYAANEDSKFYNENIGKTFNRTMAVNVAEAKLNGSIVYTSEDIERYVKLHTALGAKETSVELIMTAKEDSEEKVFAGLTKNAVNMVNSKNPAEGPAVFTLSKDANLEGIEIVGGGKVFDVPALNDVASVPMILSNEAWTMDDALDIDAGFSNIENKGTLTINGTKKSGNQNTINEAITNKGTINLGTELVKVGSAKFITANQSVINIAANQELQFTSSNDAVDLQGTINVKENSSRLTATAQIINRGTINNYGIVAGNTATGWVNSTNGVINVMDDNAITYVMKNQFGTIVLKNRNDEVKIDIADTPGKIVYTWKDEDGDKFKQVDTDKFTYVVFNNINLNITDVYDTTSMEFQGLCNVTVKNQTIDKLVIANDGDFRFKTGNSLTVSDLENNGLITIGGAIKYTGTFTNNGRVLTTGNGAITKQ